MQKTIQPKWAYTKSEEKRVTAQKESAKGVPTNEMIDRPHAAVRPVECCRVCKFIRNHVCKRFPPVIGATAFIQPIVSDTDWCGCFEKAGK